jgi:DnaJ-class molecular chaperone
LKILLAFIFCLLLLLAWRYAASVQRRGTGQTRTRPRPALMGTEEALEILGLERGADDAAIIDAHRRLMQKVHPDKGGSAYLAQQLNEAKRVLLQNQP